MAEVYRFSQRTLAALQFLISIYLYSFNLLGQYHYRVWQSGLLRCVICIYLLHFFFFIWSFCQEGGDPVAYYPSMKGLPKEASFFNWKKYLSSNRHNPGKGKWRIIRNLLPDKVFLLSSVIALEREKTKTKANQTKKPLYCKGALSIEK